MPNIFKGRKRKGSKATTSVPSQNVTPSTSTLTSTDQSDLHIERIDWALEITGIVKDISEASPLLAPVKATCGLITRGLELAREKHQTRSDFREVSELLQKQKAEMDAFTERLEGIGGKGSSAIQPKLETYLKAIQEALVETTAPAKSSRRERFSFLSRARPAMSTQEDIPALKQKLDTTYQDFMDVALLAVSEMVEERMSLAVEMEDMFKSAEGSTQEQVQDEPEYDYDSPLPLLYGHGIPCCQPGTRTAILAHINQWAVDAEAKEKIYWLKDAAGTGKTTVAATCARDWQVKQTLAGRFFFTPNSEASSGIDRFCTTVAKDISFLVPSLDGVITAALDELSRRCCGFHEQFERLIVKPLHSSKPSHSVILIFDALDNCDRDGRRILLSCLLEHLPSLSHVKVLLTSRPSPDIVDILSNSGLVGGQEVQLLDIHDEVRTDVRIYVHSTLTRLDNQEREKVVEYSGGLFIVAATACRMLRLSSQPMKLLNKLLAADSKDHLDELYLEALRQAVWNGGAHERMMSVLRIIIVTFQPVSINTIAYFLSAKFDVGKFVQDLGAVLKDGHPERPIKVLHPTFREFLSEFERANGFIIDKTSSHTLAAIGCLNTLEKLLDYDILHLRGSHSLLPRNSDVENLHRKLSTATTAAMRYASSYWAYHVAASLNNSEVWLKTLHFLSTKLLNWIELMSLRGDLGECIQGLSQLRVKTLHALREKPDLLDKSDAARISDVYRFLLQQQPLIQDSALQTYASALAFTADGSPLLDEYRNKHVDQMPRIISTTPSVWSTRDILTGHTSYVRQLEFSPDGSRLASRSEDCSLILWDTNSGAVVGYPFKGGVRDPVVSLAFSPDGQQLAFATKSSKIYIWGAVDGKHQISTIDASPGEMVQIVFSPTQSYLISASTEPRGTNRGFSNDMRLWSTLNGQKVGEKMWLEGGARCIAVSPDGLRVVCVSKHSTEWAAEGLASLWSLESFLQLAEYGMQIVHDIHCVCYSPTGNRFVTWDQNSTIYLRNGHDGEHVALIKGQEKSLRGVCFSPNGNIMASSYGWENPIIHLWDPETGVKTFTLSGHSSAINYITFTQDSLRLASVSIDQTVRVWDTFTGSSLESFFSGYTGHISNPVLSPDWSKLITVSHSYQINLHDVNHGTMQGINEYENIKSDLARPIVAFSPDGDVMVCGYFDLNDRSTLGLWSLDTCLPVGIQMVGHRGGAISVAFSNDAKYISSLSQDNTMRIWDASGHPIGDPFPVHDGYHTTFSPDSTLVGCGSYDGINVWQVHTGTNIFQLDRRSCGERITFSSDNSRLAGGFEGKIGLWDLKAGPHAPPKLSHSGGWSFSELAFSPNDDLLASAKASRIGIWRISDELQLISELPITPSSVQLGISSTGRFLVYGSSVWDLSSLPESPILLNDQGQSFTALNWKDFPHSLLTYDEGWIYSASPPGRLLPIPHHLWKNFRHWDAYGHKVVIWTQQRLPVVIDTSPLLSPTVVHR